MIYYWFLLIRAYLVNILKTVILKVLSFPVNTAKCLGTAFYIEYICEYELFEYYAVLSFFFRSVLARTWLKVTLPKDKSKQKL